AGLPGIHPIAVLREALFPAQREMAADALAASDWRREPQNVEALILAARNDPAASVRAACCRNLARMGANIEPVTATLPLLRNDVDPRVRTEAEQALTRLVGAGPAALQPVRGQ